MWPWGGGAPEIDIGDNIQNSLMLDSTASQYLSRVFGAPTDGKKWTWSGFVKRGKLGLGTGEMFVADGTHDNTNYGEFMFFNDDKIWYSGWTSSYRTDPAVRRDTGGYSHICLVFDSTQTVEGNRLKLYFNGVQQSFLTTVLSVALNQTTPFNVNGVTHAIGGRAGSSFFDGYLSNVIFIDGQALDPSYFGRTSADTGAWVNKTYTGTYGTNGFKLEFLNGASLGTDTSGNGNHWTLNGGIVAANQFTDTPTNNFCVLNAVNPAIAGGFAIYRGNLKFQTNTTNTGSALGSIFVNSGKWYWEVYADSVGAGALGVGIGTTVTPVNPGFSTGSALYNSNTGEKVLAGVGSAYGASWATGATIGVAYDADTGTIEFFINNVSQGQWTPAGYAGTLVTPHVSDGSSLDFLTTANFGASAFAYTPPTGFKALCTANLPQPSIIKPSKYFKAKTRTGTGAAYNVTGIEFSPELVWSKSRSNALSHLLADAIRGVGKYLSSNSAAAEVTDAQSVTAFNSDGYSGGTAAINNTNSATYIDWMWDKGVIPGLDIVPYLANGVSGTLLPHGLGVAPKVVLIKARDGVASSWIFGSESIGWAYRLYLESAAAKVNDNTVWLSTPPGSSNVTLGGFNGLNTGGVNYVAYLFAEVEGFSKFGSYVGNGSADGPFVYCGFRPAFVMWKRTDASGSWFMSDSTRQIYNPSGAEVYAESAAAESVTTRLDYVSNGFKLRAANAGDNASGGTYIFMAFAENSVKYSNAR